MERTLACVLKQQFRPQITKLSRHHATQASLKRTFLHDFHKSNGGKMVPFAGYEMPVQYKDGVASSHLHVREKAGLFDVSHMLQTEIHGKDRIKFIESLVVGDIERLEQNHGTLTLFTNDQGGIKDDLIVNKVDGDFLYIVSNAGCANKDLAHLRGSLEQFKSVGGDAEVITIEDKALIALQGPSAIRVLQSGLNDDLSKLTFMTTIVTTLFGIPECRVTRCGYTGEDGVEISVPASRAVELCERLLSNEEVQLAGLGARDSLRLEAGLCLYDNDIDETTTPVEASLLWTVGKRRRETADFPGADVILDQIKNPPSRKRVGFTSTGPPARGGTTILSEAGDNIGIITSGCPSPCLKSQNIAMGYVAKEYSKRGTAVQFEIRKKRFPAQVTKMPFVPHKYYTKKS